MTTLAKLANTMARNWNSAFRIKSIEKVPGPTIIGNAKGTTEAVSVSGSILKMEILRHMSKPSSKMMMLPARIKEGVLIPNNCRIKEPPNKKESINKIATIAIFQGSIALPFLRMFTTTAKFPGTLSVANKMQQQERNCWKLNVSVIVDKAFKVRGK